MIARVFDNTGKVIKREVVKYATSYNFFDYRIRRGKADSIYVQAYNSGLPIIVSGEDVHGGKVLFQKYPRLVFELWGNYEKTDKFYLDSLTQAAQALASHGVVEVLFGYNGQGRSADVAGLFIAELLNRSVPCLYELNETGAVLKLYVPSHPYVTL